MTATTLTMKMLLTAETNGFGFLGHSVRRPETWAHHDDPHMTARMIDQIVLDAARKLKLTPTQFAEFLDSKAGRWFGDSISVRGFDQAALRPAAIKALSAFIAA